VVSHLALWTYRCPHHYPHHPLLMELRVNCLNPMISGRIRKWGIILICKLAVTSLLSVSGLERNPLIAVNRITRLWASFLLHQALQSKVRLPGEILPESRFLGQWAVRLFLPDTNLEAKTRCRTLLVRQRMKGKRGRSHDCSGALVKDSVCGPFPFIHFHDLIHLRHTTDKSQAALAYPPRAVFGVPLEEALDVAQIANLPAIVFRCIQYLEAKKADQEEGIYRLSGSSAVIKNLKDRFNSGEDAISNHRLIYLLMACRGRRRSFGLGRVLGSARRRRPSQKLFTRTACEYLNSGTASEIFSRHRYEMQSLSIL
jgi:RhoGAP domain